MWNFVFGKLWKLKLKMNPIYQSVNVCMFVYMYVFDSNYKTRIHILLNSLEFNF